MEETRDQNRASDYASSVQGEADIDHGNGKNGPSNPPTFHPTPANAAAEDESRNVTTAASRTHDNLFGPSQVSSRQRKIYHMASDIFGVGSIVDRSGSHVPGPGLRSYNSTPATSPILTNTNDFVPVTQAFADRDSKTPQTESGGMRDIEGNIIDQTMDLPSVPGTPIAETESPKFNARDNGSNPVTGDGYIHDETPKKSKSQRRHYPQVNSPSLW